MAIDTEWLVGLPGIDDRLKPVCLYLWNCHTGAWMPYLVNSGKTIRTTVIAGNTDRLILAENHQRFRAFIYNNSSGNLFLALGVTPASQTSFTIRVSNQSFFELPQGYVGEIRGIWSNNNGNAQVTELIQE